MRRIGIIFCLLMITLAGFTQPQDPVHWQYKSTKIDGNLYEITFSAFINMPWHIYSMDNDENITPPTSIQFTNNPLVEIVGAPKETGSLKTESISGGTLKYYEGQVQFVQRIKLKAAVKVNISGEINYMTCTGGRCLPPIERKFSIALQ